MGIPQGVFTERALVFFMGIFTKIPQMGFAKIPQRGFSWSFCKNALEAFAQDPPVDFMKIHQMSFYKNPLGLLTGNLVKNPLPPLQQRSDLEFDKCKIIVRRGITLEFGCQNTKSFSRGVQNWSSECYNIPHSMWKGQNFCNLSSVKSFSEGVKIQSLGCCGNPIQSPVCLFIGIFTKKSVGLFTRIIVRVL